MRCLNSSRVSPPTDEPANKLAIVASVTIAIGLAWVGVCCLDHVRRFGLLGQRAEVVRVRSSSGIEAAVIEWDNGATSDVGHEVHVAWAEGSAHVASLYVAHLNERGRGVVCRWQGDTLVIEYWRAVRAERLRETVEVGDREVRVVLADNRYQEGPAGKMVEWATEQR